MTALNPAMGAINRELMGLDDLEAIPATRDLAVIVLALVETDGADLDWTALRRTLCRLAWRASDAADRIDATLDRIRTVARVQSGAVQVLMDGEAEAAARIIAEADTR